MSKDSSTNIEEIKEQITGLINHKFNFINSNAYSVVLTNIFKTSPHLLTILSNCFIDKLQYQRQLSYRNTTKEKGGGTRVLLRLLTESLEKHNIKLTDEQVVNIKRTLISMVC